MSKIPRFDGGISDAPVLTGLHNSLVDYKERLQAQFRQHARSSVPEIAITGQAVGAVLDLVGHMLDYNERQNDSLALRDRQIELLEARLQRIEGKQAEADASGPAPSKKLGLNL